MPSTDTLPVVVVIVVVVLVVVVTVVVVVVVVVIVVVSVIVVVIVIISRHRRRISGLFIASHVGEREEANQQKATGPRYRTDPMPKI